MHFQESKPPIGDAVVSDTELGTSAPSGELKRSLKNRHMQMIAIGGSIGAGLFVGSGGSLSAGGPASLVIDFSIIGLMLLFTVHALGELAVLYPINGAFYTYSVRFIDPAWGFAMGWNYAFNWLIVLPFELVASSITLQFWSDKLPNQGIFIAIFLVGVIVINIFGVKGYGEVEFVLGTVKVIAIIGFIILAIVINVGGVPTDNRGYIGAKYWSDPGAFRNGFKGFCSVFVTASFAFGGTELVGLSAAETENPRKTLPKATKQVLWRIMIFYVISLFLLGLVVPANDPLLANASGAQTKFSPFVRAMTLAGIPVLPSIFNAVILISVISVANTCSYGSTRTLQALAMRGHAPKIFAKIDSKGRPIYALLLALAFGFLGFIVLAPNGETIFFWLLALSGLSNFFSWGSINFAHIQFRRAWKMQGRSLDELPFKAGFGVWGSYIGLSLNILCLIAQFYVALLPINGKPDPEVFFQSYLAAPVVLIMFIGYKAITRDWKFGVNLMEVDLDAGRRDLDISEIIRQENEEKAQWSKAKRVYDWCC
ncbi:hypothetical protein TWF481_003652 [Arthrobotrys musiformis]|uniref:Amino acid permease/ SLC12A domain-containing protein n=1 Tax=Arthrobotrys musiformis TaxID=47236 RepID=A0AAV9WJ38_9PEZI